MSSAAIFVWGFQGKEFTHCGKDLMSREPNRQSQMFSFVKMAEKYGSCNMLEWDNNENLRVASPESVPIHLEKKIITQTVKEGFAPTVLM